MTRQRQWIKYVNRPLGPTLILGLVAAFLLVNIDAPLWDDEATTMNLYVLNGWTGVMSDNFGVNNHRLFSLLTLATTQFLGTAEFVIRAWSVIPAVLAVLLFYRWLARRLGTAYALVGAALLAVNVGFIDLASQGRGYGLVFLGWGLLTMYGLDYLTDRNHADLSRASFGSLLAIFTFPLTALPVTISYLVLWASSWKDRKPIVHLATLGVLSMIWFRDAFGVLAGARAGFAGHTLIAPVELSEAYRWLFRAGDLVPLRGSVGQGISAAVLLIFAYFAISAALRAGKHFAMLFLAAPATVTLPLAWVAGVALWDRYTSFFVFPALVVTLQGVAALLERHPRSKILTGALIAMAAVAGNYLTLIIGDVPAYTALALFGVAIVVVKARVPDRPGVIFGTAALLLVVSALGIVEFVVARRDIPIQDFRAVQVLIDEKAPDSVIVSYSLESIDYYLGEDYQPLNRVERPNLIPLGPAGEQIRTVCNVSDAVVVIFNHYDPGRTFDTSCLRNRDDAALQIVPMLRGGDVQIWLVD